MIVLDTHTLVWWVTQPDLLSPQALKIINEASRENKLLASSISIWEIALLHQKKRLVFSMELWEWLSIVFRVPGLTFVPVDNVIALQSVQLPGNLHSDPADRIIVSTAREYQATLITKDARLLNYPHVKSLW